MRRVLLSYLQLQIVIYSVVIGRSGRMAAWHIWQMNRILCGFAFTMRKVLKNASIFLALMLMVYPLLRRLHRDICEHAEKNMEVGMSSGFARCS